jgi:hypothetical protein
MPAFVPMEWNWQELVDLLTTYCGGTPAQPTE